MADFNPEIGLVIRHAYLWWSEARKGREEGLKDRPCVIIHLHENEHREIEVYISLVTHSPPEQPEKAMEIPTATKKRLGLDKEASWIITTEVNRFVWPGPDIRAVASGEPSYGLLPAAMTRDLIKQIRTHARKRELLEVKRDDEALNEQIRERRKKSEEKDRDSER